MIKLQKIKVPGVKVTKPATTSIDTKHGKLHCMRSLVKNKYGTFLIQLTSKDANFSKIFSIDVSNNRYQLLYGFKINEKSPKKFTLGFVQILMANYKPESTKVKLKSSLMTYSLLGADKKKQEWNTVTMTDTKGEDLPKGGVKKFATWLQEKGKKARNINELIHIPGAFFWSVMSIVSIFFYLKHFYQGIVRWQAEYQSNKMETTSNSDLFIGQQENDPAFIHYDKVNRYVKGVADGKLRSVILYGPPGMGKTFLVKRCLHFAGLKPNSDFVEIKGSVASVSNFFVFVYENKDKIIVMDDFDVPMSNPDMVNILKAMTDSYKQRRVALPSSDNKKQDYKSYMPSKIPTFFDFDGRVIIITNLDRSNIDKAILSRSPPIEMDFNAKEMIKALNLVMKIMEPKDATIEQKREVLNHMKSLYKKNNNVTINYRNFHDAVALRMTAPMGWQECVAVMVGFK
jgi:hypothetical protein